MVNVKYAGPFLDYSGYGEANRQFIYSLQSSGVGVQSELVRYTPDKFLDFGLVGQVSQDLSCNNISYNVKIIHVTPDQLPKFVENGKYNIAHVFWETDLLPQSFVQGLSHVQEIWTGSEANLNAIRKSGVDLPVYIFPQPYCLYDFNKSKIKYNDMFEEDKFIFYSIFEWTPRKNAELMIHAFIEEFSDCKDVSFVLKTYNKEENFFFGLEKNAFINYLKSKYCETNDPKIHLITNILNKNEVAQLHEFGDCYVSAGHGEGWGIPVVEALSFGKEAIVTGYGGVAEHMKQQNVGKILDYDLQPLHGMENYGYYHNSQNWAEVSISDLKKNMREVYNEGKKIKEKNRIFVKDYLSPSRIGKLMKDRITEIEGNLI